MNGEWRKLNVDKHEIKVKNAETIKFNVYETHRGPLLSAEDKDSSEVLF